MSEFVTRSLAVIMSVYRNDTLTYTKLSVESVINQTYTDFDLFIQFDGPVNTSVEEYIRGIDDPRVHVYSRQENKGLAFSLNELLSVVLPMGYQYVARMDADDINENNRFECQMNYLDAHSEVECLGTCATEITSTGEEYYKKRMPETHDGCRALFRKRDCIIHPTAMFRRSYFDKAGIYSLDTYFAEDTMLWAQGFAVGCTFANVPEYLYKFRIDDNFFDRRRGWKHAKSIFQLRHKVNRMLHFGLIADIWALGYATAKLMPTCILNIIYKTAR